jgi:CubicO group peptidase (beta-lactamase class C family)
MRTGIRILTLIAACLLVAAQVGPALAAPAPTTSGTERAVVEQGEGEGESNQTAETDRGVDSRAEVESFVDATMAEDLREHHISGATVSVVKDGRVLFSEGYGYADRRNGTPVSANRTLFRVGSVSKLFVWTAVMQLVEDGTLDPNASVNRYLDDVQVPEKYDRPVTLRHLATHSAGFEERLRGIAVESPEDVPPLAEALQDMPARVRPPGEVTSYSNHGTALAAHVVAQQADTPFSRYVEQQIYEPLNMTRSTFRQPVPDRIPGRVSEGYRYQQGEYVRGEFETIAVPPAGSMSATATDVANFMLAHLQGGEFRDSRILSAAATERMHRKQFANHPALNGMAFGFYEQSRNGVRIIGHGGDTQLFHSGLWLFPERDLGVFVSYNSANGPAAREEFIASFTDHFFPTDGTTGGQPASAAVTESASVAADGGQVADPPLSAFTGAYRSTRVSYTSFEKIAGLNTDFRVQRAGNGTLVLSLPGQETTRWVRTGQTVFEQADGDGRMAFRVEDGRATYVFFDRIPPQSFERIAWWETTTVQGGLFAGTLLVALSGVLGWPAAAFRRRWRRWRGKLEAGTGPGASATGERATGDRSRAARWLAGFAGLLGIGFFVGLLAIVLSDPFSVVTMPTSLQAVLAVPLVLFVATLGVVAFAVLSWTDRYWGLFGRVHYALVALALVVFVWQLSYWNLLTALL